jgi:hypothetical protein
MRHLPPSALEPARVSLLAKQLGLKRFLQAIAEATKMKSLTRSRVRLVDPLAA